MEKRHCNIMRLNVDQVQLAPLQPGVLKRAGLVIGEYL